MMIFNLNSQNFKNTYIHKDIPGKGKIHIYLSKQQIIIRFLVAVQTLKQQDIAVLSYCPEKSKLNFFLYALQKKLQSLSE